MKYRGEGSVKDGRRGRDDGFNSTTWDYYTYPGEVVVHYHGGTTGHIIYHYGCVERRKKWIRGVEIATKDMRPNGRWEADFQLANTKEGKIVKVGNLKNIGGGGLCGVFIKQIIEGLDGKIVS